MTASQDYLFAAAVVAAAWAVTPRLGVPSLGQLWAALRLAAFFLLQSLRAGVIVARQALSPTVTLKPHWRRYPLNWPEAHPGRALLIAAITLLPGTFTADWREDHLLIHDLGLDDEELAPLVQRVAALFPDLEP